MKYFIVFFGICIFASCNSQSGADKLSNNQNSAEEVFTGKVVSFYENGQLKFEEHIINGIKHGEYRNWYQNGKIKTKGEYSYGKRNGTWVWCDKQGNAFYKIDYSKNFS